MKRILTIATISLILFSAIATAEPETLFDSENITIGGFGGPTVGYTQFNGEEAVLTGIRAAMIVNHKFYIGIAGYGIVTQHDAGKKVTPAGQLEDTQYIFGYGGGLLGYTFMEDDLVHGSAEVLIGGGGLTRRFTNDWDDDSYEDYDYHFADDRFFCIQPMVNAELNVTKWMRCNAGLGYRWTEGINKWDLSDDDTSGLVAGIGVSFGWF